MQMVTTQQHPLQHSAGLVVLGVFQGELPQTLQIHGWDKVLEGMVSRLCQEQRFTGKAKQQMVIPTLGKLPAQRLALVGLGKRILTSQGNAAAWVSLGALASHLGAQTSASHVVVIPPHRIGATPGCHGPLERMVSCIARGAQMGAYRFDAYKSEPDLPVAPQLKEPFRISTLMVYGQDIRTQDLEVHGQIGQAVNLARGWVNQPPSVLYPETFANQVQALAQEVGLTCEVWGPQQLEDKGLRLHQAVGAGSVHAPRLVQLHHVPPSESSLASDAPVVLVGKGITFDSGGLCLKSAEGMLNMKADMGGAAAVAATVWAVAKMNLPFPVHGILALAENMPSATAYRPGDVVISASGKSVEITNTDAEGRLVLADALHVAQTWKPSCIVDIATLTGAIRVALGLHTTGLFSNDDALAQEILQASQESGEDVWRMPLTQRLQEQLKSQSADLRNTGDRFGGAITAALFLQAFVGDTPWAHLDIAGPSYTTEESGGLAPGGTGVGVATLVEFLRRRSFSKDVYPCV